MSGQAGLLELSAGSVLRLDGTDWTVAAIDACFGRVRLDSGGDERWRSIRWLAHHRDCQAVPAAAAEEDAVAGPRRQPVTLDDLTSYQREVVRLRAAHVLETETGFRSGAPLRPAPGEPRPAFDPRATTLEQRRQAKVAELKGLGADEAALLGLGQVGERTLKRMAAAMRERGLAGCIDRRWVRPGEGHPVVTEEVREAIFAARAEFLHRSKMSMRDCHVLASQYALEKFGPHVQVPSYWTVRAVWLEWFGPGGTRQRYVRTAEAIDPSKVHIVVHRPGQVVALDTTPLPVKVRDGMFGDPVSVHLTIALDMFTHSLVAFRLTLVSDTAVDVAMLLRDVMMPLPMREGWGPEMEWPYPGVPADIVAEFAGHRVAGLPFFAPETVTTDHGGPYKAHALAEAQRALGCNILPARTLRPQDKAAVERAFGALRTLLFAKLPGYTGVDVADRGADPEADAALTMAQMERLIADFAVRIWQNRRLGEHAPAWGPGEEHSPNTLLAAAMEQGGFRLQVPKPELYYELLPAYHVKVHPGRGVKVHGLWYGKASPALQDCQGPSGRGGTHKNEWVIRADRRDLRQVFLQDPADPSQWHVLRWNKMPPEGEIPAFSDKTAEELLAAARQHGLSPRSDDEQLPELLRLLGGVAPVSQWATQLGKKEKKSRARAGRPRRPGHRRQERPRSRCQRPDGRGRHRERGLPALARAGCPGQGCRPCRAQAQTGGSGHAAPSPAPVAGRPAAGHEHAVDP